MSFTAGTTDFKPAMLELGGIDPSVLKNASVREKDDQKASVEKLCDRFGGFLIDFQGSSLFARTKAVSLTTDVLNSETTVNDSRENMEIPPVRIAVVDFAATSSAAQYKAGKAIADRFEYNLRSLKQIDVISTQKTQEWLNNRGLENNQLNPETAAELARELDADFILGGTVVELVPDWEYLKEAISMEGKEGKKAREEMELFEKNQLFQVTAELISAENSEIPIWEQFEFTKQKAGNSNPEAIQALFVPASYNEVILIAPNLEFYDLRIPMLGTDTWHRPDILRYSEHLEGSQFTTGFFADSENKYVKDFVEAYKGKYADIPETLAAQSYDAALLVLIVMHRGIENRVALRNKLAKARNYKGVTGLTTFAERQDAIKRLPILEIKNGLFKEVRDISGSWFGN